MAILTLGIANLVTSCSEDKLSSESVIATPTAEQNAFDKWLEANFVIPYNIKFMYRYEENESDFGYYTVPADMESSIKMAHLVKYICIESYNEVGGVDFTRAYFPKEFFLIGEWEYKNNGSYILGTAEGGKKILLSGMNHLNEHINDIDELTYYYLKTIHHEFTHILNQTQPMPTDFQFVSGDTYIGSEWSNAPYNKEAYYLGHGHISAYAQQEDSEDFAEMLSKYVCYSEAQWNQWLADAETYSLKGDSTDTSSIIAPVEFNGRERIEEKMSIVKRYMNDVWHIDVDKLRATIQRRESEIQAGKVDLTDLTIK